MRTLIYSDVTPVRSIRGTYKLALLTEQLIAAIPGLVFVTVSGPIPGAYQAVEGFSVSGGGPSVVIGVPDSITVAQVNAVVAIHDDTQLSMNEQAYASIVEMRTAAKAKVMLSCGLTGSEMASLFGI